MATSNFGNTIFSKYFTVAADERDDYDDMKDNLAGALADVDGGIEDNDGGEKLAHIYREVEFCGVPYEVRLDVLLKPGYYEGAYLDGRLFIDGVEYDSFFDIDADECADMLEQGLWDTDQACQYRSTGQVRGFCRMQAANLARRFEKTYNKLLADVEKAVAPCTDKLAAVATFSNGETWYERVS